MTTVNRVDAVEEALVNLKQVSRVRGADRLNNFDVPFLPDGSQLSQEGLHARGVGDMILRGGALSLSDADCDAFQPPPKSAFVTGIIAHDY